MKFRLVSLTLSVFLSLCMIVPPALARGGGFGGRGGGFGGFRGGGGFGGFRGGGEFGGFRSGGFGGLSRPSSGLHGFGNIGGHGGGFGNRPGGGFGNRPAGGFGNFGGHGGNFGNGGFNNIANRSPGHYTQQVSRQNLNAQARGVRNSFNNNNINVNRFNNFGGGYGRYGAYGYHGGYYGGWWGCPGGWYMPGWGLATMWTFAGVAAITSLVGLSSMGRPKTVDYGTNVYYQGDNVYINGQPQESAQQYYNEAQQLADSGRAANPKMDTDSWKSLGVFSVVPPGQTDSTMLYQLAINKDGLIGGNYYNQITNETVPVSGKLDKKTQRVSWTTGKNSGTVFDTSLGNLMENQSTCLVHYGPKNTQQMSLIRIPDPNKSGAAKTTSTSVMDRSH